MKKLISKCPCCDKTLRITTLQCPECGMEMKNDFELSVFDRLNNEQYMFLVAFLQQRGNLKNVQSELGVSYPTAKKKLDDLLVALELASAEEEALLGEIDMSNLVVNHNSTDASEIIKSKLMACGGRTMVRLQRGDLCEIFITPEGKFMCPKLIPYDFEVFDVIVKLLLNSPGYRAKKGNARAAKLGEPGCEENTAAGAVLLFMGKKPGESGLDPVFVLAAVLDWAGIAHNERGELALAQNYRSML